MHPLPFFLPFYRAINQLEWLQRRRKGEIIPPPVNPLYSRRKKTGHKMGINELNFLQKNFFVELR